MNYDPAPFLFLRPAWLALLVLVPVVAWFGLRLKQQRGIWDRYVDSHLREAVIEQGSASRGWLAALWLSALMSLAIVALAGPSWRQSEQPLWGRGDPMVIVLDMSTQMLADDVPGTRLGLAKTKIAQTLKDWAGDVGMVVYADQPFTVSPITEDPRNVEVFLDPLQPEVMPRDGEDLGLGIRYAVDLLQRDSQPSGTIWVLSANADGRAVTAAAEARAKGYRVSVLGIGSGEGIDESMLREVAQSGDGQYRLAMPDSSADLRALALDRAGGRSLASHLRNVRNGFVRQDNGFWLLPFLLTLAPLGFRRKQMAVLPFVLAGSLVLAPGSALAQDGPRGSLWLTPAQQQARLAQQADAAYKDKRYEQAATLYGQLPGATARYNQANALAKAGQYRSAIQSYDRALRDNPGNTDAKINKAIVEQALKSQLNAFNRPSDKPSSRQNQANPSDKLKQQQDALAKQREAERKMREEMQKRQAQQAQQRQDDINPLTGKPYTPQERRSRDDLKKQLAKVKDDPGGLLRNKFYAEYIRRFQQQGGEP